MVRKSHYLDVHESLQSINYKESDRICLDKINPSLNAQTLDILSSVLHKTDTNVCNDLDNIFDTVIYDPSHHKHKLHLDRKRKY